MSTINPLAIAVQGLGFGAAQIALQGLLQFVVTEVQKAELLGGNPLPTRRTRARRAAPNWLPLPVTDDDEALLLLGIL